jgi:excisionase family DNA binding protein
MAELVDLREAAKESKISIFTWRAWISQRRIPYVRLGRRVLLRREDFERFITQNLVPTKAQG